MDNAHDDQTVDELRAAELERLAEQEIARLDLERQEAEEELALNVDRVLANLEREAMKENSHE